MGRTAATVVALMAIACGGSSDKPAAEPGNTSTNASTTGGGSTNAASSSSAVADAPKDPPHMIPGGCAGSGDPCVPDPVFVKRLCNGSFPDVALLLMSKNMPFTHAYLRGDVDGWNAEGGASARARLKFDEEVLILRKRSGNTGGMQVSGSGGYLVMRWDGNCYTLGEDEVTMKKPPTGKWSPIAWRFLAEATQNGLLDNAQVKAAYDKRSHECKGAVSGDVTLTCQKADEALSAAVVSAVRSGATVPTPERIP